MNQSTFYEVRPGYAGEITPSASRRQRFQFHLKVETFDVGTGQTILITAPNGRTMLVDTGSDNRSTSIADALARQIPAGSPRAFLLTHPHKGLLGGGSMIQTTVSNASPVAVLVADTSTNRLELTRGETR